MRFGTNDQVSQYSLLLHVSHFLATLEDFVPFLETSRFHTFCSAFATSQEHGFLKKERKNRTSALLYHFQKVPLTEGNLGP